MACTVKYGSSQEWAQCRRNFAASSEVDEICGCDPSLYLNPIGKPKGKADVSRLWGYLTGGQAELEKMSENTGFVTPPIETVLDPDGRPVTPGEVVGGGLGAQVFYAPNKAASALLTKLPRRFGVVVAGWLPWLFWLLVAWWAYSKLKGK
jgi:hypothetical protein